MSPRTSQCVILVGGLGTRLGQLTHGTPKPLLAVAGQPFLQYLITEAARFGFVDIVLLAGYTHRPDDLVWMPGPVEAVRQVNDLGFYLFVVTNQAGVARGYYPEWSVREFHEHMDVQLARHGTHVDQYSYCPHHPEGSVEAYRRSCPMRKLAPGMILKLARMWSVDMPWSILVGDKRIDIEAAHAAAIEGCLFTGGDLATFVGAHIPGSAARSEPS